MESEHICMPYTIERQLKSYAVHPEHDEQHDILWNTLRFNKQILTHILRWTLVSFPMYSRHDDSHANAVLRNMERVLGEERIKKLSPTDCFVLLHVAYEHDIGMCITDLDRDNIIKEPRFLQMIKNLEHDSDWMMAHYARIVREYCESEPKSNAMELEDEKSQRALQKNLEIYHAMSSLLANFQRMDHGRISRERIRGILDTPDSKFNEHFCESDIPSRIFLWISECAGLHTVWGFERVLELPYEDDGAAYDKLHPRFAAVMLQLGDALDMDNGRFPLLMTEFVGKIPQQTKTHMQKHAAIRMLHIDDRMIEIRADCESHEVSRLIQYECRGINELLKEASYHWSDIVPKEVPGTLPSLRLSQVTVRGRNIPASLISANFSISQQKAFSLLEGNNIYPEKYVFLREILQNAFDASKVQYWNDCKGFLPGSVDRKTKPGNKQLFEAARLLPLDKYPVEINLTICGVITEDSHCIPQNPETAKRILNLMDKKDSKIVDLGVLVEVRDYGCGIGEKDILCIADVGVCSEAKRQLIDHMPDVLSPTGAFGIGLQSIFLITNHFLMKTRTRSEEAYSIRFSSMTGSEKGIINTTILPSPQDHPFGTSVQVLVQRKSKVKNTGRYELARMPEDPFSISSSARILHDAEELMAQLVIYLDSLIGERLFPIHVCATDLFTNEPHPYFTQLESAMNSHAAVGVQNAFSPSQKSGPPKKGDLPAKFVFTYRYAGQTRPEPEYHEVRARLQQSVSWAFCHYVEKQREKRLYDVVQESGDRYWFDLNTCKLHLWCDAIGAFAGFGADRFCDQLLDQCHDYLSQKKRVGIPLYYKGIKVFDDIPFVRNLDLLEYIDLKSERTADILQLNRCYFTEEGKIHFSDKVGTAVLHSAQRIFLNLSHEYLETSPHTIESTEPFHSILDRFQRLCCQYEKDSDDARCREMAGLILLAFLGKMLIFSSILPCSHECEIDSVTSVNECPWEILLRRMDESLQDLQGKMSLKLSHGRLEHSKEIIIPLVHVKVRPLNAESVSDVGEVRTLAYVFSSQREYAGLIRQRSERNDSVEYQLLQSEKPTFENSLSTVTKSMMVTIYSTENRVVLNRGNRLFELEDYSRAFTFWLLHNVQTSELHMQTVRYDPRWGNLEQNTTWIHVFHIPPKVHIRTNHLTKYLLLCQMRESTRAYRFSTIVWEERFRCLALPMEAFSSVAPVIPENIVRYSCPYMVIPCNVAQLEKIFALEIWDLLSRVAKTHMPGSTKTLMEKIFEPSEASAEPLQSIIKIFKRSYTYYTEQHDTLVQCLSDSQRFVFQDWITEIREPFSHLLQRGSPEQWLEEFFKAGVEKKELKKLSPKISDVKIFRCFLHNISKSVMAVEAKFMPENSFNILCQGLPYDQSEDGQLLLKSVFFQRDFLCLLIERLFAKQFEEDVHAWKASKEAYQLGEYISAYGSFRISPESAVTLNQRLYRQIVDVIAHQKVEDFLSELSSDDGGTEEQR